MASTPAAIQDHYPNDFAHCYGCGHLNEHGLHVKSAWEGDEVVARFRPKTEPDAPEIRAAIESVLPR